MNSNPTLREQLRRNAVALISLAIAITSLGYNTWRNEASESNRNQRLVSIQLLLMLGELHQVTLDRQYGTTIDSEGLLRMGWGKVLTIRDLSTVTEGSVPESAQLLFETWQADFQLLGTNVKDENELTAKDRIIAALESVRSDTHEVLRSLD